MPLWFLRHGESEANARGRYAGGSDDSPLTEKGRRQARTARDLLPNDVSWIVSSPLSRAYETAQIVRDALDATLPIELDGRVAEFDMGSMSGMPYQDVTTEEMVAVYGAEDPTAFWLRVTEALDELSERDGTGLLVAHTGVARVYVARREGLGPYDFRRAPVPKNGEPFLMV
ncbi:MAG: histidine phosphatase family protein [Acidimicrobiales bacterium]